ncbi:GntR family transcriptional regulator [Rhizobium paknamense]|uniref:GntR family transcriptional regulator n=1 Tax=Rhizobium paknamense TaxID=1206817 RepID=A0ABU0IF49_9HYPH|nr:GntR family transcriptional regulator [Rhizobium paknamense]MDQ0455844.1 GntR family transcriptional regulator [Rhizobium paknamense]
MKHPRGSLPLYLQVVELLVRDIAAGRLQDGEKLPPERDMAVQMDMAVGTLRKALSELEARGLLQRIQGSGNYIRAQASPRSVYALFRLELLGGGGLPTAEVLSVERLAKPPHLPHFGQSRFAHRIRRLRCLSGQPAAMEEIWLDAALIGTLSAEELSESLYLFYRTRLGLWIEKAEDCIGQQPVPSWRPAAFSPQPNALVPHIIRRSFAQDGSIPEVSETWYDPSVAHYVSRLR